MRPIELQRPIAAPQERVFEAVAHIQVLVRAIPRVTGFVHTGGPQRGVGCRYTETRELNGRPASTEMEVVEYVAPEVAATRSDSYGITWDSRFTVHPTAEGCLLRLCVEARPHTLLGHGMGLFVGRILAPALARDLEAIEAYCLREG